MDEPLAHRAQRGDEVAFRALYRAVHPGLLRYLRVLVGEHDADDVGSETWLQLVRDLGRFRGDDAAFRAWAARVGRNRAMDHLRRRSRRPAMQSPPDLLDELPGGADPETHAEETISTDRALSLIATLPPDQGEAVLLRVVMGLDAEAAGRVLGKRAGAVRVAAHRGLRRLAASLAEGLAEGLAEAPAERNGEGTAPGAGGGAGAARGVTSTAPRALKGMR